MALIFIFYGPYCQWVTYIISRHPYSDSAGLRSWNKMKPIDLFTRCTESWPHLQSVWIVEGKRVRQAPVTSSQTCTRGGYFSQFCGHVVILCACLTGRSYSRTLSNQVRLEAVRDLSNAGRIHHRSNNCWDRKPVLHLGVTASELFWYITTWKSSSNTLLFL